MEKVKLIFKTGFFIYKGAPEQYNDDFNTAEEIREKCEYESSILVVDDRFKNNQKAIFYDKKT